MTDPPARASALTAVGLMAVIAVGAVAGVLGLGRLAGGAAGARQGAEEREVPAVLADGRPVGALPDAVAAAVDGPVVAVWQAAGPPEGMGRCDGHGVDDAEPMLALVTPEAGLLLERGRAGPGGPFFDAPVPLGRPGLPPPPPDLPADPPPGPPPGPPPAAAPPDLEPDEFHVVTGCVFLPRRGGWGDPWMVTQTFSPEGALPDTRGATCCLDDGMSLGFAVVEVGDDVAWALQDRGAYWLAYPVTDRWVVAVWRYREGPFGGTRGTELVLIGPDGAIIEEYPVRF